MTPWQLAKDSEHSHQRALFAWANLVARFGFQYAAQPEGYTAEGRKILGERVIPWAYVDLRLLFAIHNQGHGDAIRGNRAKAEGVKAGVPDLFLPVPIPLSDKLVHGLFIELKPIQTFTRKDKGRAAGVQIEWIEELNKQGYMAVVAHGWIGAANVIASYLGSNVRVTGADPD